MIGLLTFRQRDGRELRFPVALPEAEVALAEVPFEDAPADLLLVERAYARGPLQLGPWGADWAAKAVEGSMPRAVRRLELRYAPRRWALELAPYQAAPGRLVTG